MQILHLRYFRLLAQREHFTKTAEELFISQPNLSYAISVLEKELGVKLFQKFGRKVSLSPEGKTFYEYVNQALKLIDMGIDNISYHAETPRETIGIGVSRVWFLMSIFDNLLAEKECRNLNITFKQGKDDALMKGIFSNEYQIIMLSQPVDDERLSIFPIKDLPLVFITPLNHPLASRKSMDLRELGEHPVVIRDSSTSLGNAREIYAKANIIPHVIIEAYSFEIMACLVERGIGVGVSTDIPLLKNIQVKRMPIIFPDLTNTLYIAINGDYNSLSVGTKAVFDYILKNHAL